MCGDRRWEQVPIDFARGIQRLISPPSTQHLPESPTPADLEPALCVLLIVRSGRNRKLSQIVLGDADINTFFEKMRKEYFKRHGILHILFSVWRFTHCEFYRV
jgi:hypothetical protein